MRSQLPRAPIYFTAQFLYLAVTVLPPGCPVPVPQLPRTRYAFACPHPGYPSYVGYRVHALFAPFYLYLRTPRCCVRCVAFVALRSVPARFGLVRLVAQLVYLTRITAAFAFSHLRPRCCPGLPVQSAPLAFPVVALLYPSSLRSSVCRSYCYLLPVHLPRSAVCLALQLPYSYRSTYTPPTAHLTLPTPVPGLVRFVTQLPALPVSCSSAPRGLHTVARCPLITQLPSCSLRAVPGCPVELPYAALPRLRSSALLTCPVAQRSHPGSPFTAVSSAPDPSSITLCPVVGC